MTTTTMTTIESPTKTLTVLASIRGKVPSVYVGKTFDLIYRGTSVSENGSCDRYSSTMKSGKEVWITRHHLTDPSGPQWFIHRPEYARGTWLYDVIEGS